MNIFNTTYCKELSDRLWKRRNKWVGEQAVEIKNNSIILDIGAGNSYYKQAFISPGVTYIRQDLAKLPTSEYGKLDIISDITSIPLPDNYADIIICSEVFEHVPYPIEAIKEISRLLKVGGKLIFSAPLGSCEHQEPYHFYGGYTQFWYKKFFPENNLQIKSIEPNGGICGHTAEMLWQIHDGIMYNIRKTFYGKLIAPFVQLFMFNIPTVLLWMAENKKVVPFGTTGYFVIAYKI